MRTETGPAPRRDEVALYPGPEWEDSPLRRPPSGAALDHPLYAFNARTRTTSRPRRASSPAAGRSEGTATLMDQLGFTHHQMTIPLALNAHGARDTYALVSETPYTDDDLRGRRDPCPRDSRRPRARAGGRRAAREAGA